MLVINPEVHCNFIQNSAKCKLIISSMKNNKTIKSKQKNLFSMHIGLGLHHADISTAQIWMQITLLCTPSSPTCDSLSLGYHIVSVLRRWMGITFHLASKITLCLSGFGYKSHLTTKVEFVPIKQCDQWIKIDAHYVVLLYYSYFTPLFFVPMKHVH